MSLNEHRGHEFIRLDDQRRNPYSCSGCKLLGMGERYVCNNQGCDYLLHEDCFLAFFGKNTVPTPFHPEDGNCVFYEELLNRRCDGCKKRIEGFMYHHNIKGWDFHPTCANLKHNMKATNEHRGHHFKVVKELSHYTCSGCKELGMGDRYECCDGSYILHKDCYSAFIEKKKVITVSLHPDAGLCYFLENSLLEDRHCDACHIEINGFVYHHFDKGWDFHPTCANLQRHTNMLDWEGRQMTFTLREKQSAKCRRCGNKDLDCYRCGKKGVCKCWCYVSGEYHFHVYCMKLMLLDALAETETTGETSQAMASTRPKLNIVAKKKEKGEKIQTMDNIVVPAISSMLSVLAGDPTGAVPMIIYNIFKKLWYGTQG